MYISTDLLLSNLIAIFTVRNETKNGYIISTEVFEAVKNS